MNPVTLAFQFALLLATTTAFTSVIHSQRRSSLSSTIMVGLPGAADDGNDSGSEGV